MNLNFDIFSMVKNVLVVDDKQENRDAAKAAIMELFPDMVVMEASSAEEARAMINTHVETIDFVFSDMQMEEDLSGFYVAYASWSRFIPAIVITAGDHHGSYVLASSFCSNRERGSLGQMHYGMYRMQPARKDDPDLWKDLISQTRERSYLAIRVAIARRSLEARATLFDSVAGEILARVTCSGMGNIQDCKIPE